MSQVAIDTIIGRWRVVRAISVGPARSAFGDVYEVSDIHGIHGSAALKLYREGIDVQDIKNLARTRHTHIVGYMGDGVAQALNVDRRAYLVMELGTETLTSAMRHADARARTTILDAAVPGLLSALDHLHNHVKLAHRDVKPDNILLAGLWKLGDFGLTTSIDNRGYLLKRESAGTFAYMAPELFGSHPAQTVSADIFAIGATVHYLLTGRHVWAQEHLTRMDRGEPPGLPQLSAALPASWRPFVTQCLEQRESRPTAIQAAALLPTARSSGTRPTVPSPVPGKRAPLGLASTSAGPGHLEVFRVDPDGSVWHRWFSQDGWSEWFQMPSAQPAAIATLAAASLGDGHQELFAGTADGGLLHRWFVSDEQVGWTDWHTMDLPPAPCARAVQLASSSGGPGTLEIFRTDDAGRIWHRWFNDTDRWSDWHQMPALPSAAKVESLTAVSHRQGHQELVVVDAAGQVSHRWYDWTTEQGGSWSDWHILSDDLHDPSSLVAASSLTDGHHEIYASGSGPDALWHRWWWQADHWSDWAKMAALPQGERIVALTAGSHSDRHQELFATGVSQTVWHSWNWLEPDGTSEWSEWYAL